MLKAVPESPVFTVHLGTALHWRGLGRGMGLFCAFAACPGRPEGTRARHPCPFPNPTSGDQDGADLWWPIGGLQGPVQSVTSWLCSCLVAFPSAKREDRGYMSFSCGGSNLSFLASKGARPQRPSLPSGDMCT